MSCGPAAKAPQRTAGSCGQPVGGVEEATESLYEADHGTRGVGIEKPHGLRVALGTRIPAVLELPVTTSPEGAPVTARVLCDVLWRGEVAIPADTRVEGLAFGTETDDRARILFIGAVLQGRTLPLRAVALDTENSLGLPGKVLSRDPSSRARGNRFLRALTGGGALDWSRDRQRSARRESASEGDGAQERGDITEGWAISSKSIRVPEGTALVIYVRSEAVLP